MKADPLRWRTHDGKGRPRTGDSPLYVRIRVLSRMHVEAKQTPLPASAWRRWTHDGGPGDIIEWRYA